MDNFQQYLLGRLNKYYQPKPEHMPEDMLSFEVYADLEIGVKETGIPAEHWIEFDCTTEEPIEMPSFLD